MSRKRVQIRMADGFFVNDLDEIKEHFDIESVTKYFQNGDLLSWLNDRYYEEEAEQLEQLATDDPQLQQKLSAIFGVGKSPVEIDPEQQERLNHLKWYTNDPEILANVASVAFDQAELGDRLDEGKSLIYLCANRFTIPLRQKNKTYIGVGNAVAVIRSNKLVDFEAVNIRFQDIDFDEKYAAILQTSPNVPATIQQTTIDPKKLFDEAEAAYDTKDYKTALEKYKQAAELGYAPAFAKTGVMYYYGYGVTKDIDEARRWYKLGMEKNDGDSFGVYAALSLHTEKMTENEKREAFKCMKRATELKPDRARWWSVLGNMYIYGTGTGKDAKEAFRCYDKAIELDDENIFALTGLAECYRFGKGVTEDKRRAFELYLKAAELGDTDAMKIVGVMLYIGEGTTENNEQSFYWTKRAVDESNNDDAIAIENLAYAYRNGIGTAPNPYKAFELYEQAAELGDAEAMNIVGVMLYIGEGTTENNEQSFYWTKRAVDESNNDDAIAIENLAYAYRNGIGTAPNPYKAFELYEQAANLGNIDAMNIVGVMLYNGEGTAQNDEQSFYWTKRAVDESNNDDAIAIKNLAYAYLKGIGTAPNPYKAIELYEQAANLGNNSALVNLGRIFRLGDGVPKDFDKAIDYFSKAADSGNGEAMNQLGLMYSNGEGVSQDLNTAFQFFSKAAEAGNVDGISNLGICYLWGDGVAEDVKTAEYWIEKAAENGDYFGLLVYANWIYSQNKNDYRLIDMYERTANAGYGEAAYRLSVMYRKGYSTGRDNKAARYWEDMYKSLGYEPDQRVVDEVNNPKQTKKSKGFFESLFS